MTNKNKKGYAEIISAVSLWGINSGIVVKNIVTSAFLFYPVASLFGLVAVTIGLIKNKSLSQIRSTDKKFILFLVGILIFLNNGSFYYAIQNTTIANAVLLHYLAPLFVVLSAPFLLKEEKWNVKKVIASLLGLAGMIIILSPQVNAINIGIIAGLASALFYAMHTIIEKRLTLSVDPMVEVFYKNSVAASFSIITIPMIIAQGLFTFEEMSKIAFLGITALGLGFIFFFRGLGKVSSQNAMVLTYLEALIAITLGSLLFGEEITSGIILGGLMIIGAGIAIIRMKE